jgi:hypothetical protein
VIVEDDDENWGENNLGGGGGAGGANFSSFNTFQSQNNPYIQGNPQANLVKKSHNFENISQPLTQIMGNNKFDQRDNSNSPNLK